MSYTEWLNNEYDQWVKALQESTVDNFGSHPIVRRMLGDISVEQFNSLIDWKQLDVSVLCGLVDISRLGGYVDG